MEIISKFKKIHLPKILNEDIITDIYTQILEDNEKLYFSPSIKRDEAEYLAERIKKELPDKNISSFDIMETVFNKKTLIKACQILFEEREGSFIPVDIRVEEEIRGQFYGNSGFILENKHIKSTNTEILFFKLLPDEKCKNHITMFVDTGSQIINKEKHSYDIKWLFWELYFDGKWHTNLNKDLFIQKTFLTKKDFLTLAKRSDAGVSLKTLSNYRKVFLFPEPAPIKVNGITTKYYDPEWIKYLIFIKKDKMKSGQTWSLQTIRERNESFFKDIPKQEQKKNKKRRQST